MSEFIFDHYDNAHFSCRFSEAVRFDHTKVVGAVQLCKAVGVAKLFSFFRNLI